MRRFIHYFFVLCLVSSFSGCSGGGGSDSKNSPASATRDICTNNVSVSLPAPGFTVYSAFSDPSRTARPLGQPYDGAIADVHLHWGMAGDNDAAYFEEIETTLQRNNIQLAIFMPKPGDPNRNLYNEVSTVLAMNIPRISVFNGGDYITAFCSAACADGYGETDLSNLRNRLAADLNDPLCSGIGEVGITHFEKFAGQSVYQYQPNFQPFLDFLDLMNQENAWLDIHAEPYSQEGDSFENMVFGMLEMINTTYPGIRLIVSHSGMTNPVNAERILTVYPDIMMNIKLIFGEWDYLEPINNSNGAFYEDWAQLFERMPDRFMIGTDAKFKDNNGFAEYDQLMTATRLALGSLSESAARMIAFENAAWLF